MNYTEVKFTITPREPYAEILSVELADIGFDSFIDTELGLDAYIPSEHFSVEKISSIRMLNEHHTQIEFVVNNIPAQNWNALWESNFNPIEIGTKLYIRAPFHLSSNLHEIEIIIEPKMSFGTGHHETTHLMCEAILNLELHNKTVLDMGCGTGILAILASKLNAKQVLAYDIENWAVENANENIVRNNTKNVIVNKGSASSLQNQKFDIILANINKNVLLKDISSYFNCLHPYGEILLSGFFSSDADELATCGTKIGLKEVGREERNNWCLLHFKKN